MLPDRPGIEVCRELRSWSELPIIVLSAVTDEQTKIEALQNGADDYVTKPFAPGELVARVQAVLRRAGRAATEPRIEADGLVVDLAAHTVTLDGEEVHLTPIEFSLLRALATNRGLLMTHRKLLTEVWGPEYADATSLLRTHIANLRRKLQARGGAPALHPHRLRNRLPLHRVSLAGRPSKAQHTAAVGVRCSQTGHRAPGAAAGSAPGSRGARAAGRGEQQQVGGPGADHDDLAGDVLEQPADVVGQQARASRRRRR